MTIIHDNYYCILHFGVGNTNVRGIIVIIHDETCIYIEV